MSRGTSHIRTRNIEPDIRYKSATVAKFINYIMLDGKKSVATTVCYKTFELIDKAMGANPVDVFETALRNASPVLEVKGKRVGGANYQIPFEVPRVRRQTLAMKWMIKSARDKQGKSMAEFLSQEIMDAYNHQGAAIKKKDEMHRMAEANKAFAHFAKFV
jgi:small subunit ribosomal protein S7